MKGTIFHRESFLSHIQHQLGKNSSSSASIHRPEWRHQVQWETNGCLSKDELVEQLKSNVNKFTQEWSKQHQRKRPLYYDY